MIRQLSLLILTVTIATSLYADEKTKEEAYKAGLLNAGQIYWKFFYPHQTSPQFFCPPQGGWPQNPGEGEIQKIADASKYMVQTAITFAVIQFVLPKIKPTCKHWAKKLMQKQNTTNTQPFALTIKTSGHNAKDNSDSQEQEEELVFIGSQEMPLFTLNMCGNMACAFGFTMSRYQAMGTNTQQALAQASIDAGIEGATDLTYNLFIYSMNRIGQTLQIQNPFDTKSQLYEWSKCAISWLVKVIIRDRYRSLRGSYIT
jgi:hypothetical protein